MNTAQRIASRSASPEVERLDADVIGRGVKMVTITASPRRGAV